MCGELKPKILGGRLAIVGHAMTFIRTAECCVTDSNMYYLLLLLWSFRPNGTGVPAALPRADMYGDQPAAQHKQPARVWWK
jgi:hypothetical protein